MGVVVSSVHVCMINTLVIDLVKLKLATEMATKGKGSI